MIHSQWFDADINCLIDILHEKTETRVNFNQVNDGVEVIIKPMPEAGNDIVKFSFDDLYSKDAKEVLYRKLKMYLSA
jgi:hypothetical protein